LSSSHVSRLNLVELSARERKRHTTSNSYPYHLSGLPVRANTKPCDFARLTPCSVLSKTTLMLYCFLYRKYPSVRVFWVDHRNDIVCSPHNLVFPRQNANTAIRS